MNKICTTIEQSKKLIELGIDVNTADMLWTYDFTVNDINGLNVISELLKPEENDIPCWSLAALLKCLGKIKPQVYTPILFLSEGKWVLQFVEYGHGNVCEVSCNNPVDACYEMIIRLHEQNLL